MKLLAHPIILPPALTTACVAAAWLLLGPAWAAGAGLAGAVAWLLLAWRLHRDLHRLTAAMHRLARVDRNAALPMRVSAGLAAFRSAATDLAGMLRDVREHLGGERLRRRILEEALREGLVILDAQQRVLVANETAGRLLGFEPGSARGRLLQQCTRSPALNQVVSEAFAQGQRRQADIEPPGAPGLVAEAVVAAVTDEAGRMAGGLLLLSDVTAARSLDRMRADFAANVSHELRTPITNIRGYVETLLQVGMEDPQVARKFLDIVHRNASRLGALVEDLLTLAFVESPAGRDRIEMDMVHVASLFDWVEAELGPAAEARNIRIERLPEPGLRVHANTLLAEQAVGNLVSNAIRYAPDGSTVQLGARSDAGFVAITVHDNGPGIPDRHLPRLFERFYRVDTARTREGGGTGLGLAIVKHIAMVHGGTISVQSTVGKGSAFTLRLPAQPRPETEHQASTSAKFA
jgi:two-component system phosphate regulon sensor histidine kinase PhoR